MSQTRGADRHMTMSPLRWWAVRSTLFFGAVYLLGLTEVPTFIPYVTACLVVASDLIATVRGWWRLRRSRRRNRSLTEI